MKVALLKPILGAADVIAVEKEHYLEHQGDYLEYLFINFSEVTPKERTGTPMGEVEYRQPIVDAINSLRSEIISHFEKPKDKEALKPRITFSDGVIKFGRGDGTLVYMIPQTQELMDYFGKFEEFVEKPKEGYSREVKVEGLGTLSDLRVNGALTDFKFVSMNDNQIILETKHKKTVVKEAVECGALSGWYDATREYPFTYRIPIGAKNVKPPTYEIEE